MRSPRGLSLVEVLVALLVLAAGIFPAIYGVAASLAAARRGRARAEVAATLLSRAAVIRNAVACGSGEILLEAEIAQPGGPVRDSVRVRVACW